MKKTKQGTRKRDATPPSSERTDRPAAGTVDDASDASFPASDPPSWSGMRVGGPASRPAGGDTDEPTTRRRDEPKRGSGE